MPARIAWALAGLTTVMVVFDAVLSAQAVTLWSETAVAVHGFPFIHCAVVGSALMGALIISRYERHPIGWLLSIVGALGGFSLLTEAYAYWVQESDGPGSEALAGWSAWVSNLLGGQLAIAGIAVMFLIAPDGHFLSRRWRYAAWLTGVGAALYTVALVSLDPAAFQLTTSADSFGPLRGAMLTFGFLFISAGIVASVVSMVLRLRRSTGAQRQQVRLIALSAALIALGILALLLVQIVNGGKQTWAAGLPLYVAYFLLPILFAIAILRYRLYELEVIVNRTVVVVAGVAFAALGYVALVVTAGELVQSRTGGYWLSLLGITLVALAFQPLRRSVVRFANRVAYGARAQPYEALADFSRRLSEAPDPDDLLPAVAEAAARAVSARGARATLDVPGGSSVTGTWGWWSPGPDETPDHVVPVSTEGRELGRIEVVLPRGRSLLASDLRLLQALADQTVVAFRNTSLASTLAERVAELDRTTRRLAGSRMRLIEAEDAARRALEAAITRDVLPFLDGLPGRIRESRAVVATGGSEHGIDALVDGTNQALESLRDLTRGVFPSQLARAGLGPALRTLVTRSGTPATLTLDGTAGRRFSPRVEAAVYFCCVEATRAGSGLTSIELTMTSHDLVLRLSGRRGKVDLQSITDRAEAAGGRVNSAPGRLELCLPVESEEPSAVAGTPAGVGPGS